MRKTACITVKFTVNGFRKQKQMLGGEQACIWVLLPLQQGPCCA